MGEVDSSKGGNAMGAAEYAVIVRSVNTDLIRDIDDAVTQSVKVREEVQAIQDKYAHLHHLGQFLVRGNKSWLKR
jgi:hypothetical protein